ncbi:hypothetical protein GUJ93_ZPchr0001g29585 [Zizania palustris]|uniref:Uncharacterized protein n=1 Tax=Zizania palustris TaxID=103762 RepID=A0A8J5V839_ZIZPA|nr:hypothetical protein GUJ93_ZPchr0001g29585 [Zizania palustris]
MAPCRIRTGHACCFGFLMGATMPWPSTARWMLPRPVVSAIFFPKVASFLEFFRYSHPALRNQSSISPNRMEPSSASAVLEPRDTRSAARLALSRSNSPADARKKKNSTHTRYKGMLWIQSCSLWIQSLLLCQSLEFEGSYNASVIPVKIGIDGLGKMGMLLAEVALLTFDVEVVAINDHSISNNVMADDNFA